jgi:hypothetical protein
MTIVKHSDYPTNDATLWNKPEITGVGRVLLVDGL